MTLSKKDFPKKRLQAVAACCLLIACKFEEIDQNIPNLKTIAKKCNGTYSIPELRRIEREILQLLEFDLRVVTPMHFLEFYFNRGVVFQNDRLDNEVISERVIRYIRKYAEFFADLSLQEYLFQQYSPQFLAVSCIIASRKTVKIVPSLNPELFKICEVESGDIEVITEKLLELYYKVFPERRVGRSTSQIRYKKPMRENFQNSQKVIGLKLNKAALNAIGKENSVLNSA